MKTRILAGWFLLLGIHLVWPNRAETAETSSLRAYVEQSQRRQAYGVYIRNRKFGWAIDEVKLGQHEGKEVAISTFEMQASFTSAGEKSSYEGKSLTYYSLAGDGEIAGAHERILEDGNETVRIAVREGNELVIKTRIRAGETQRRVPVPKERLQMTRQLELWLGKTPKKGAQFTSYSTSWDQEEVDTQEVYTYRGKKTILWGGVKTEVYLVTLNMEGMAMDCEVMADGTPIKGFMGGLFELRAEKESVAKMPGTEPIDMLEASAIKVDKDLGEPENVLALTLRITGLRGFNLPTSHRQRIRARYGNTLILELARDQRTGPPAPLPRAKRETYLRSTPTLQSDHEAIRNQAQQIIGSEKDPLEIATLLQEWVFRQIRQTMTANTSSALDVLSNRAGDCTEITMLFVALARAAGLPAREVGGVMYANEGTPIFGWHAWAEVHDGHQWTSIDPTWNQVYVDATHIKLAEDSNDWGWVNLLGKMKIKVLKVRKKD